MSNANPRRIAQVTNARLVARNHNEDHLARRVWLRTEGGYSELRYRNLLRCPAVVFAGYGAGL